MQYLTYEEYTEIGGTLDSTAFNRNIDRVCGFLANETQKRIDCMRDIPREVKACCRDLLEYMAVNTASDKAISNKSQSVGAVSESVTFKAMGEQITEMQAIVYDYLASVTDDFYTPLLYRGCKR